jgi:glucokinase
MTSTCAIGLDVGGTKTSGGVVSIPSGRVLVKQVIPTKTEREGQLVLSDSLALARELVQEAAVLGRKVLGVGVGVAELVDLEGNVTSGQTIHWNGLPVQERFSEIGPAVVESDVRAAALAESLFGAGKSFPIVVYVTVGTGISYSLVNEGRPFPGARGNALILSSSPLTTRCTHCGEVLRPILEEFSSGPALVSRYNQKASNSVARAEEVLSAVELDPMAFEVVRTAGEALGVSVAFLVNTLDPQAVIVGGGLGLAGGLYWSSFVSSAREHIWAEASRNLPILKAALGTDAGLIGAAATVVLRKHPGQFRGQFAELEGEEDTLL